MSNPKFKLVNTEKAAHGLIAELRQVSEVGFDTESAGPLLRNRKWKAGKTFINVSRSTMIGFSLALPPVLMSHHYRKDGKPRANAPTGLRGYYIPLYHNKKNLDFYSAGKVISALSQVPSVWMHNAKHDFKTMLKAGYDMGEWPAKLLDSSIAAYLFRGDSVGNGLKELTEKYLGRKCPEFDVSFYNKSGKEALEYAAWDAVNTLELGKFFDEQLVGSREFFHAYETKFACLLGEMEHHGLGVDKSGLAQLSEDCRERMAEIETEWCALVKGVKIGSDHDLQKLFKAKVWPDHGERTGGGAFSCNRESLEILQGFLKPGTRGRALVDLRLEYQMVSKIATTYTLGFIEEARQHPDGRLHPDYRQQGTKTGRLSSANPNGQNIPVRNALGREVKKAIVPRKGHVFVALDYSQIELRVLAHFAGGKLAEAYINDEDVHQQTCDAILDVCECDRDKGKTVNFALQYGASAHRLAKILNVNRKVAKEVRGALLSVYPELDILKTQLVELADSRTPRPFVKTLAGRIAYIDDLLSGYNATRKAGERKAVNYTVQGSAFDIMKIAMVNTRDHFIREGMWNDCVYFVSNVHDEMTMEVVDDPGIIADVCENSQRIMEAAYKLNVPLKAEPKVGKTWLDCK